MTVPRLQGDDLSVRRLRVRASRSAPEAPGALAREMARGLERADWPSAPDDAWVLVRRLTVSATRAAVTARAPAALAACLAGAADAGSPDAERAQAVRFRDLPDLLAHLAADLAAGCAGGHWYWRRWPELLRLSPAEALASLLGDHAERLGTVTERLAELGALALVWRSLTPAQARDLKEHLAARIGMTLPGPRAGEGFAGLDEAPPRTLRGRWAPALLGLSRDDPRRHLAACLVALEWRPLWLAEGRSGPILAALGDALGDTREGMAAGGLELADDTALGAGEADGATNRPERSPNPTESGPRPTGNVTGQWGASLHPSAPGLDRVAGDHGPRQAGIPRGDLSPDTGEHGRTAWERASMRGRGTDDAPLGGPRDARTALPERASDGSRSQGATGAFDDRPPLSIRSQSDAAVALGAHRQLRDSSPERIRGPDPIAPGRADAQWSMHEGRARRGQEADPHLSVSATDGIAPKAHADLDWETGEGGLFYLINFLARPEAQALLRAGSPARSDAGSGGPSDNGWAWLADLGLRLGLAPEGSLARFLAERLGHSLGPDCPRPLADLPAVPAGPALMDLGQRLYGGAGVWMPTLLHVPARTRHTPTHLDIDYPLGAVRVEVRCVALDINPGWVPWLGRVVTFRYLAGWSVPDARASPQSGACP